MVTLKQIARASGVSTATVSYVVNDGPRRVLPETRERVLKVIQELNYRPNVAAQGLRGKRTNTFGVAFPHIVTEPFDNVYFGPILAGIVDVATARRQMTMLFTGISLEDGDVNLSLFCDGRCDGFIFVAIPAKDPLIEKLSRRGAKMVLVGTQVQGLPVSTVDSDNVEGARQATLHLLDLGHRRIGIIQGNCDSTSGPERTLGFRLAHQERGVPVDESLLIPSRYQDDAAYLSSYRLLSMPPDRRPTAIFAAQDSIARMAYTVASELGIRIPEDVSLVGFDDVAYARHLSPPLTTVRQPLREIGAEAATVLFNSLEADAFEPVRKIFQVDLIERASCRPPGLT
ncbi:MAG TPA: LacI family DNA-binding transcriptional regulator [Fimbriimonas sp.]|nr:LacI family DNA-binding transcriptional regulator [Fimbriimonas sp.]